jgi:hypothetical protein
MSSNLQFPNELDQQFVSFLCAASLESGPLFWCVALTLSDVLIAAGRGLDTRNEEGASILNGAL